MNDRAEAGDDESDASDAGTEADGSTPTNRAADEAPSTRADDRDERERDTGSPDGGAGALDGGADAQEHDVTDTDGESSSGADDLDQPETEGDSQTTDADESDDESGAPDDGPDASDETDAMPGVPEPERTVPADVRKYERFKKMDGAQYDRVNEFLRDRTYVTAREWAIARLCADFRTETGVEMTKIGENLPELVPFMTDTYTPQAVNQARSSFDEKVRKAGATFLYGAMCDFYTAAELDDVMYEVTEVSKFLLEVEGVDLSVEDELEAEERISSVMREVRRASKQLREEETLGDGEGQADGDGGPDDAADDDPDEAEGDPESVVESGSDGAETESIDEADGGASDARGDGAGADIESDPSSESEGGVDGGTETGEPSDAA